MDAPARAVTAACILAVTPASVAMAQQGSSALPAVTVDAPQQRPRPAARPATRPVRSVATAQRRRAPRPVAAPAPVVASPQGAGQLPIFAQEVDASPYGQPGVPYKVNRLASQKFAEPIVNQPRTVVTIPKEVIQDKGATSLRDIVRTTPGLTLGTGEGGNAFGDRIFIRGFDARSDIFIDGVRDPTVGIRESFNIEQVEILKGPASSFAGRGTAGGALNIVTKKAVTDRSFRRVDVTVGTANTKRATIDINQVITPEWAVRINAMGQKSGVAGRDRVRDDRYGVALATTFTPNDRLKITADYTYVKFDGLPDWGVPYNRAALKPWTETGVSRSNYYGLVNRDFQKATQNVGSLAAEIRLTDFATLNSKLRIGQSILDYVATPPESVDTSNANPALWTVRGNPKSRYQLTNFVTNQTDVTLKYNTFGVNNTTVAGVEVSRETTMRDTYAGLASEAFPSPTTTTGSYTFNLWDPNNDVAFPNKPRRNYTGPTIGIDTKSAYVIHNANWNDFIIVNAGVRYDDYNVQLRPVTGAYLERHDGLVNYNAGVVVKPLSNASVYAAVATSSNPVGADVDGGASDYGGLVASNVNAGPERNTSYELGTKWEFFDRKLLATAALFQTEKTNARETVNGTVVGSAAYRVRGVEFGLNGKITDAWSVYSGLVLMESKVTQSAIAANQGKQLANIAHQSFNLMSKYRINRMFEIGGSATYISKVYGGTLAATTGNVLPPGWRFDAFAEAHITKDFAVKVAVYNIFDKNLYEGFYRSNTPFVYISPGRLATISATYKF